MDDSAAKRSKVKVVARLCVLFAAGFLVCIAMIHLVLPAPLSLHAAIRTEKLLLLEQWSGRASSAIFGSSHVHNGFDPRPFDAALKDTPIATTTVNLGVVGGSQAEQRAMAIRFAEQLRPVPDKTCFVVLELNARTNITDRQLVHPRSINLYDWQTVRFVSQLSTRILGRARAAGQIAYALAASGLHYSNVGMLSSMIFAPPADEQKMIHQSMNDRRGLTEAAFLPTDHDDVRRQIGSAPPTPSVEPRTLLPGHYELLSELRQRSAVRNVRFVYWVSPRIADLRTYPDFPDSIDVDGVTSPILSTARPDIYPQIYRPENWSDESHLNDRGAALVSKVLAEQMLAWYRDHPQPMGCDG
jgi:hypothetical protein